jgi:hypothetical protein
MKYLHIQCFLLSFAIGLCVMYYLEPTKRVIKVYPTPDTVDTVQYVDKADNCFNFEPTLTECPWNTSMLKTIPIQV